jgi:hypothetical protein
MSVASEELRDSPGDGDPSARIRELESALAAAVERMTRAEAALADTQFDLLSATRRADAAERALRPQAGDLGRPVGVVATESRRMDPTPRAERDHPLVDDPEPGVAEAVALAAGSVLDRLARLRGELRDGASGRDGVESAASTAVPDEVAPEDLPTVSLRDRLTRAAHERHRVTGGLSAAGRDNEGDGTPR